MEQSEITKVRNAAAPIWLNIILAWKIICLPAYEKVKDAYVT